MPWDNVGSGDNPIGARQHQVVSSAGQIDQYATKKNDVLWDEKLNASVARCALQSMRAAINLLVAKCLQGKAKHPCATIFFRRWRPASGTHSAQISSRRFLAPPKSLPYPSTLDRM